MPAPKPARESRTLVREPEHEMSFPEIKAAIEQTAGAFEAFKQTADKRAAELLDRIEAIEAKAVPGVRTGPGIEQWRFASAVTEEGTFLGS